MKVLTTLLIVKLARPLLLVSALTLVTGCFEPRHRALQSKDGIKNNKPNNNNQDDATTATSNTGEEVEIEGQNGPEIAGSGESGESGNRNGHSERGDNNSSTPEGYDNYERAKEKFPVTGAPTIIEEETQPPKTEFTVDEQQPEPTTIISPPAASPEPVIADKPADKDEVDTTTGDTEKPADKTTTEETKPEATTTNGPSGATGDNANTDPTNPEGQISSDSEANNDIKDPSKVVFNFVKKEQGHWMGDFLTIKQDKEKISSTQFKPLPNFKNTDNQGFTILASPRTGTSHVQQSFALLHQDAALTFVNTEAQNSSGKKFHTLSSFSFLTKKEDGKPYQFQLDKHFSSLDQMKNLENTNLELLLTFAVENFTYYVQGLKRSDLKMTKEEFIQRYMDELHLNLAKFQAPNGLSRLVSTFTKETTYHPQDLFSEDSALTTYKERPTSKHFKTQLLMDKKGQPVLFPRGLGLSDQALSLLPGVDNKRELSFTKILPEENGLQFYIATPKVKNSYILVISKKFAVLIKSKDDDMNSMGFVYSFQRENEDSTFYTDAFFWQMKSDVKIKMYSSNNSEKDSFQLDNVKALFNYILLNQRDEN